MGDLKVWKCYEVWRIWDVFLYAEYEFQKVGRKSGMRDWAPSPLLEPHQGTVLLPASGAQGQISQRDKCGKFTEMNILICDIIIFLRILPLIKPGFNILP